MSGLHNERMNIWRRRDLEWEDDQLFLNEDDGWDSYDEDDEDDLYDEMLSKYGSLIDKPLTIEPTNNVPLDDCPDDGVAQG